MTAIAFIHSVHNYYYDKERSYSRSVSTINVYIVRDDPRFTLLAESVPDDKLEDVALKFGVIELEKTVDSLSQIWGINGDRLGKDNR